MEENKDMMLMDNEVEEEAEEIESSGNGLGILATMGIGAALGIGIYKGVSFLWSKIQDCKKKKTEVIEADCEVENVDGAESEK